MERFYRVGHFDSSIRNSDAGNIEKVVLSQPSSLRGRVVKVSAVLTQGVLAFSVDKHAMPGGENGDCERFAFRFLVATFSGIKEFPHDAGNFYGV